MCAFALASPAEGSPMLPWRFCSHPCDCGHHNTRVQGLVQEAWLGHAQIKPLTRFCLHCWPGQAAGTQLNTFLLSGNKGVEKQRLCLCTVAWEISMRDSKVIYIWYALTATGFQKSMPTSASPHLSPVISYWEAGSTSFSLLISSGPSATSYGFA